MADATRYDVFVTADAEMLVRQDDYLNDLTREFQLLRTRDAPTKSTEAVVLLDAIDRLLTSYVEERRSVREQAEKALRQGAREAKIHLVVPADVATAARQYLALMRQAWELSDRGALLTMSPAPGLRAFQEQWSQRLAAALDSAALRQPHTVASTEERISRGRPSRPPVSERTIAHFEETDLAAPRAARRQLRALLSEWDADEISDSVELVTAELVSNACLHTVGAVTVTASRQGEAMRVAVTDESRTPPKPRSVSEELATGRGLALVAAVADEWGWTASPGGKVVWARFVLRG